MVGIGAWRALPEDRLLVFDADAGKLSKILIKGSDGGVLGRGGCGDEAVDEMDFGLAIAL